MHRHPGKNLGTFQTELHTQLRHTVLYIDPKLSGLDFAVIVGQITLVQQPEQLAVYFEKFLNNQSLRRRPSGILKLDSPVYLFGLQKDNHEHHVIWPWSDEYWQAHQIESLNDRLNYDQYSRPLPDISARQLYIAVLRTMQWHNTKHFAQWFLENQSRWKLDTLSSMEILDSKTPNLLTT